MQLNLHMAQFHNKVLKHNKEINIVFQPKINEWNNYVPIELNIKDVKFEDV